MQALTELWTFITAWYNLPFSLALLAFLGLAVLQFIGLGGEHDADADADLDHDLDLGHDVDLDHDLDIDHDLDVDHELDHDLDHDVGHDVEGGPAWLEMLHFLGVGYAPLTMVLLVLLGSFGLSGWIINRLALGWLPIYPGWALALVLITALAAAAWITSRTARLIGRAIPSFASSAVSASQLVSRRGWVVSTQVDQSYGQVKIRDSGGTLITVFAKVDPDKPPIPRDSEVYLVDYDAASKVYTVVSSE